MVTWFSGSHRHKKSLSDRDPVPPIVNERLSSGSRERYRYEPLVFGACGPRQRLETAPDSGRQPLDRPGPPRGKRQVRFPPGLQLAQADAADARFLESSRLDGDGLRSHRDDLLREDRKSTRLNSSHVEISYAVFCLKKKKKKKK